MPMQLRSGRRLSSVDSPDYKVFKRTRKSPKRAKTVARGKTTKQRVNRADTQTSDKENTPKKSKRSNNKRRRRATEITPDIKAPVRRSVRLATRPPSVKKDKTTVTKQKKVKKQNKIEEDEEEEDGPVTPDNKSEGSTESTSSAESSSQLLSSTTEEEGGNEEETEPTTTESDTSNSSDEEDSSTKPYSEELKKLTESGKKSSKQKRRSPAYRKTPYVSRSHPTPKSIRKKQGLLMGFRISEEREFLLGSDGELPLIADDNTTDDDQNQDIDNEESSSSFSKEPKRVALSAKEDPPILQESNKNETEKKTISFLTWNETYGTQLMIVLMFGLLSVSLVVLNQCSDGRLFANPILSYLKSIFEDKYSDTSLFIVSSMIWTWITWLNRTRCNDLMNNGLLFGMYSSSSVRHTRAPLPSSLSSSSVNSINEDTNTNTKNTYMNDPIYIQSLIRNRINHGQMLTSMLHSIWYALSWILLWICLAQFTNLISNSNDDDSIDDSSPLLNAAFVARYLRGLMVVSQSYLIIQMLFNEDDQLRDLLPLFFSLVLWMFSSSDMSELCCFIFVYSLIIIPLQLIMYVYSYYYYYSHFNKPLITPLYWHLIRVISMIIALNLAVYWDIPSCFFSGPFNMIDYDYLRQIGQNALAVFRPAVYTDDNDEVPDVAVEEAGMD